MTNQHPITPLPELVQQWAKHILRPEEGNLALDLDCFATQAARWGADQELEACCEWFVRDWTDIETADKLRASRRPKPPTLKEQALAELGDAYDKEKIDDTTYDVIKRALERTND
jgi:hypothetical protein